MKQSNYLALALKSPYAAPALVVFARHVLLMMTGNKWFPSPNPPLSKVSDDVDALAEAEAQKKSGTKGTVPTRNAARKRVKEDLALLKAYVLPIIIANPQEAATIATSAGMSLTQYAPRKKPPLQALMSEAANEAIVRARAGKRGCAYEWQCSSDGGATWVTIATTTVAEVRVAGLTVGGTYHFRYRKTVKQATSDWSDSIRFVVH